MLYFLSLFLIVQAQQMPFQNCPTAYGFPLLSWSRWHIPPGGSVTANFGTATYLNLGCISGNIFDEYSGHPNFQLEILAPLFNATADLTPYVSNNTLLAQGIWKASTYYYSLAGTPVSTFYQIVFRNLNSLWNADFNFTLTFGLDSNPPTVGVMEDDPNVDLFALPSSVQALQSTNKIDDKLSNADCKAGCTPSGSIPISQCSWYTTQSWLPITYSSAAACACTLTGSSGQNSSTANCVRNYLMTSHMNNAYFSDSEKSSFAASLAKDCTNIKGVTICVIGPAYSQVINTMVPNVYKMHQTAYSQCCCPGSVAPIGYWYAIFYTAPMSYSAQPLCKYEVDLIEWKGPCGCDNW